MQKENDELKQQRDELEVRVSALKSQYEGRLSRQERELRDLRGQQERQEQRDEPPEAGPSKVTVLTSQTFSGLGFRCKQQVNCEEFVTTSTHGTTAP